MNFPGNVITISVESKDKLRDFVYFPYKIYESDQNWPGQDDNAEMDSHDSTKNYALRYIQSQLFLALRDGEVVGRISATINERHNSFWNENLGFFGHFECIDDQQVANALLQTAEQWVREKNKPEIMGPFNYTYYGVLGILVEGFEDRPTVDVAYTPRYYKTLLENTGYNKFKDLLEIIGTSEELYNYSQEKYKKVAHLFEGNRFKIRTIDKSRLKEELLAIYDLYRDSFNFWPFGVIDHEEWLTVFEALLPLLPHDLFIIVEDAGIPVAFFFGEEDYNEVLFNRRYGIDQEPIRLKAFVMGIKKEYQAMGISKYIFAEISKRMQNMQYKEVSYAWIDECNVRSLNMNIAMGGPVDKVFRLYKKNL